MSTSSTGYGDPTEGRRSPGVKRAVSTARLNDQQAQQHAIASDESVNTAARHHLIRLAAYYKAQDRGFAPGGELDDWLAAEAEFDLSLR